MKPNSDPQGFVRLWLWRGIVLLGLVLAGYIGLHSHPQILFRHHTRYCGMDWYSVAAFPSEAEVCARRVERLLRSSELAEVPLGGRVFFCGSTWRYSFFGPGRSRFFAYSVRWTNDAFVRDGDFAKDRIGEPMPGYLARSVSGVVAHEMTHGLLRKKLGFWRSLGLPLWLSEGYCEYVAQESSFPHDRGVALLARGEGADSVSFRYWHYRQMVRYLAEERKLHFAQMLEWAGRESEVREETLRFLERGLR